MADGGQFTAKARTEANVTLGAPDLLVPDGVSDECRWTLDALAPLGLRGRVEEESHRSDGWTWFEIHNGGDELRIGACWRPVVGGSLRSGMDSLSVYLTAPFGEPDHAGAEASMYSGAGIFPGDAQAIVRDVVLTAAMQEEAGKRWPDLAGPGLGPRYPLTVGSQSEERSWRGITDPEPRHLPFARLEVDADAVRLVLVDGEVAASVDSTDRPFDGYLWQVVCADTASRLGMSDASALHGWLAAAHAAAYDSPVYHRLFG